MSNLNGSANLNEILRRKEDESLMNTKLKSDIERVIDNGNSTDDNLLEIMNYSDEDILIPEAKEHYDNLSDSHQSPIDEDEEEKMEQEITNRLSHLKINRDIDYNKDYNHHRFGIHERNKFMHWNDDDIIDNDNIDINNNDYYNDNDNDIDNDNDLNDDGDNNMIDIDNIDDIDDIEDDAEDIYVDVGDEHYQSLHDKYTLITNTNNNIYKFSINREFLSNETFLKYAMFYGTIYLMSKYALNRIFNINKNKIDIVHIDTDNISRKVILISNAIITIFKNHDIWNKPHKAILSPFKDILNENDVNFMEIQKAFYFIMILLSYFNGLNGTISKNKHLSNKLLRLYNLICIGCIILIKKYKKIGGLYIYTTFWMQLSSFFMNSSKILKSLSKNNGYYAKLMKNGARSSSVICALIMIYSRIYLFSKLMIPIIQNYYRNKNQYIKSIASIGFLISQYYKCGDGLIKNFIE